MKLLYLGVYRDGTGWGEAAVRYMLALDAAGVEVVARPVKLNDTAHEPPARVRELEARSSRGADVVVQHTLPHLMDYNGRLFNVGLYVSETDGMASSSWPEYLNQMDLLVGCNRQMEEAARRSHVTRPFEVVPHPADVTRYRQAWEPLPQLAHLREGGEFVFYTIGEMVRRKNLAALLTAFHTEFEVDEPVQLVIKTSKPGMPAPVARKHVEAFCDEIKRGLKLYAGPDSGANDGWGDSRFYKREVILTERLSDDDVFRLHAACDCFVQPSYGEAWSIPAFDAMCLGKTPIVTAATGYLDYMSEAEGWLVPTHEQNVFGVNDSFVDLYTGKESWWAVDVKSLRRAMREAYEDDGLRRWKAQAGAQKADQFSFEVVGKTMREVLTSHEREARGRR